MPEEPVCDDMDARIERDLHRILQAIGQIHDDIEDAREMDVGQYLVDAADRLHELHALIWPVYLSMQTGRAKREQEKRTQRGMQGHE